MRAQRQNAVDGWCKQGFWWMYLHVIFMAPHAGHGAGPQNVSCRSNSPPAINLYSHSKSSIHG